MDTGEKPPSASPLGGGDRKSHLATEKVKTSRGETAEYAYPSHSIRFVISKHLPFLRNKLLAALPPPISSSHNNRTAEETLRSFEMGTSVVTIKRNVK